MPLPSSSAAAATLPSTSINLPSPVLAKTSRFLIDALYIELENLGLPVVKVNKDIQRHYEGVFMASAAPEDIFKVVYRSRVAHNVLGLIGCDGRCSRDRNTLYRWVKNDIPLKDVIPSFMPESSFWVKLSDGDYSSIGGMRDAEVQRAVRHGIQSYFRNNYPYTIPTPIRDNPNFMFYVTPPYLSTLGDTAATDNVECSGGGGGVGLWVDYAHCDGIQSSRQSTSPPSPNSREDKRYPGKHIRSSVAAATLCGARYVPGRDVLVDPYCCEDGGAILIEARQWAQRCDPGVYSFPRTVSKPKAFPGSIELWDTLVQESASRQLGDDNSGRVFGACADPIGRARARRSLPGGIVSAATLMEYIPPESPTLIITRTPQRTWSSPNEASLWIHNIIDWASSYRPLPRIFILHGPGQPLNNDDGNVKEILYLGHYGSLYKLKMTKK